MTGATSSLPRARAILSESTITRRLCLPNAMCGPFCSVPPIGTMIVVLPDLTRSRSSVQVSSSRNTEAGAWAGAAGIPITIASKRSQVLSIILRREMDRVSVGLREPEQIRNDSRSGGAENDDEPGRHRPYRQQQKGHASDSKICWRKDRACPYRLVECREQQADNRGIDPAQGRLHSRAPTQAVPERQRTDQQEKRRQENRRKADHPAQPAVGLWPHDCPEIGREREERTGDRLRSAIAGKERIVRHPPRRHYRGLQQGQHDMPAAEHQRARAVKRSKKCDRVPWHQGS